MLVLQLDKGIITYIDISGADITDTCQGKSDENLTPVRLLAIQSNYTELNIIAYRHPVPRILIVIRFSYFM